MNEFLNPSLFKCSNTFIILNIRLILATTLEHAPLKAVYIFIDTATYDEIERDVKVAF